MAGYKNFEVKRNKHTKGNDIFDKNVNYNKSFTKKTKLENLMEGVAVWTGFYRENPHRFAKDYLNIILKPIQQIILWLMFHNIFFMFLAARGFSKTWLTTVYCIIRCILYPKTKIVVSSGTKGQGMKIVTEKLPEIMQNSPNLKREIKDIRTSMNSDDPNVVFHNGSWIKVVPSTENARSGRANVLILDEFRLIDWKIYKNTLRRFLAVSRQPAYLNNPKYKHLQERNIEIFLSSAYYKFHWCFNRFLTFFNSMISGKPYFVCALPYQMSVMSGLVMKSQLQDEVDEDDFDETIWSMEMETLFFGESENSYYNLEELVKNRKINIPTYPRNYYDYLKTKNFKYKSKKHDHIRFISCDIAGMSGKENDASIYSIFDLTPTKKGYVRDIIYMESIYGGHTVDQAVRIMQLFNDFECDYIVLDTQNMGLGIYDQICQGVFDKENGKEYDPINCMNDEKMSERCIDNSAKKILYSIKGSSQLNSDGAVSLKDKFKRGKIRLLIDENEAKDILYKFSGYSGLPADKKADLISPYAQTSALINEMVNLEKIKTDTGLVKLKEPRSGRKDRFSSIMYGNIFADYLEMNLLKKKDRFSWESYFIAGGSLSR